MNQRDQELLDKQLWGVTANPPTKGGIIGLMGVAIFFVGIAIGAVLFAHESKPTRIAVNDLAAAISIPNAMRPIMRQ